MSLADAFLQHPITDVGAPISLRGRAAPLVQYAVACLLAAPPPPPQRPDKKNPAASRLQLALRALRPATEAGPSAWFALDPSLRLLRTDRATGPAFFRMIRGADSVIEVASLDVVQREVELGQPITITADVTARPVTEEPPEAPDLEVEFGFGDPYSGFEGWKTWTPMILFLGGDAHLRYAQQWKPTAAGHYWVMVRCRVGQQAWSYVDDRGYDISDPTKSGKASPVMVEVTKPKGPSKK